MHLQKSGDQEPNVIHCEIIRTNKYTIASIEWVLPKKKKREREWDEMIDMKWVVFFQKKKKLTVTKTKMIESKASLALFPKTKLAAMKALHKGISSVPTLTPKAAQTIIT